MEQFVHNLRRKPEHIRQRILILTMVVLMALVLVLWFATLGNRFAGGKSTARSSASPFSMLKSAVSGIFQKDATPVPDGSYNQPVEITPIQ